jgi:hypothetical protein
MAAAAQPVIQEQEQLEQAAQAAQQEPAPIYQVARVEPVPQQALRPAAVADQLVSVAHWPEPPVLSV